MLERLQRSEFMTLLVSLIVVIVATAALWPVPAVQVPTSQTSEAEKVDALEQGDIELKPLEPGYRWRRGVVRFIVTDISNSPSTRGSGS
jgi:hypothetical protein